MQLMDPILISTITFKIQSLSLFHLYHYFITPVPINVMWINSQWITPLKIFKTIKKQ